MKLLNTKTKTIYLLLLISLHSLVYSANISKRVRIDNLNKNNEIKSSRKEEKNEKIKTNESTKQDQTTSVGELCSNGFVKLGIRDYQQCHGPYDGNDTGKGDPLLTKLNSGLFSTGKWTYDFKKNSDGTTDGANSLGMDWTETSQGKGTFSFSKPIKKRIAVSMKAGNRYSVYINCLDTENKSGEWSTTGVELSGDNVTGKGLSHMSIFFSDTDCPELGKTSITASSDCTTTASADTKDPCPISGQRSTSMLDPTMPKCTEGFVKSGEHTFKACVGAYTGNGDTQNKQGNPYLGTYLNVENTFCGTCAVNGEWVSDAKWNIGETAASGTNSHGFSVIADTDTETPGTSGVWKITTPLNEEFVISLKASTKWAAYYFPAGLNSVGGRWDTGFAQSTQLVKQALSHATIWKRNKDKHCN